MFGVSAIDFEDVTLYDACADAMDMIDTSHILDVAPPGPRSVFLYVLDFYARDR